MRADPCSTNFKFSRDSTGLNQKLGCESACDLAITFPLRISGDMPCSRSVSSDEVEVHLSARGVAITRDKESTPNSSHGHGRGKQPRLRA